MIQSMTGYGDAQHVEDGVAYSLTLKSVNHRFLKLSIKLSEPLQFAESAVEKLLRSRLSRGSVSYTLRVQGGGVAGGATLDLATMQRYVDQMAQVRLPAETQARIDLGLIAALPGVCQAPDLDETAKSHQLSIVEDLTSQALDALTAMRRAEGEALRRDLTRSCEALRTYLGEINTLAPVVLEEYHERLKSRVETLLKAGELELESEGLMREVAIYAERCDISEETTRLASHLDQFAGTCDRNEQAGRTLDFITQELLREANTIAAKCSDAAISRNVVEIKGLIDRLREQVQNVQ